MQNDLHTFHIPVMGTGHSADTPIRVAPFGISSVISIVEDLVLEKIRRYYSEKYNKPYEKISEHEPDARARRITAYLDLVHEIVEFEMARIRALPFFAENDKKKYFDLLPETSSLKRDYLELAAMPAGPERDEKACSLTGRMRPGSIDVNIMVKLDKTNYDADNNPLDDDSSDARAGLRGYANSVVESALVFSAGINKGLFSYMAKFRDFYRDETGRIKKKIILKVSDFRSSLIQGRFLAKKGLEVYEYRVESGLNCGGHAFATNGHILPCVVQEFMENRDQLTAQFQDTIRKYYAEKGWAYPENFEHRPLITVQGGIGTNGEVRRLTEYFGMDATGWATPFLLVPEATPVDETTRNLLARSGAKDLYLSGASPLGVPFNNVRNSGSGLWTRQRAAQGQPGSGCPRKLLVSNTEFSERPVCTASREYQSKKLAQLDTLNLSSAEKERRTLEITEKACLCEHLGNGALISLGIAKESHSPQCICPGPNIQWFDRTYTLKEMVDHIYGRGLSLVSSERPHMFAKEVGMYSDYFEKMVKNFSGDEREIRAIDEFYDNLLAGMDFCLKLAQETPYPGENLASLKTGMERENKRLKSLMTGFRARLKLREMLETASMPSVELTAATAC